MSVRVRFAPSPTGPLHIGGIRTALFNYLFAKKNNGTFILRIEDTDQTRLVPGAEAYIIESLNWCGIKVDEGIEQGGPFSPYRQSERKAIYQSYAHQLIEAGCAYYAFDTSEELEVKRKEMESKSQVFQYDCFTRRKMKNSLTLSLDDVKRRIESGKPYVIRFKIPEKTEIEIYDIIRGEMNFDSSQLDDKVLYKSDGMPTYHLANIVDDHLMQITHVIRGEEWLPSLPLHVLLYKAFGWEDTMPQFAHLPLILKPDGQGKLSKRDGDRLGFPVFPIDWKSSNGEIYNGYREAGYLPEAIVNFLALLGWNSGTEQELFTIDELIQFFSLERVVKSGSRFDPEKAKWFNHQYIIKKSDEELAAMVLPELQKQTLTIDLPKLIRIISLVKERMNFISDFMVQAQFFFKAPTSYDEKIIKKRWNAETPLILDELIRLINSLSEFNDTVLQEAVNQFIAEKKISVGEVMTTLRLCIVGGAYGPDLFKIIELLGKDEVVERIKTAIANISLIKKT